MSAQSSSPVFTNLRHPGQERNKRRQLLELKPDDAGIKLGTVAWLQSGIEPVEYILVRKGVTREFITMAEYKQTLARCSGNSLPFSLRSSGVEKSNGPRRGISHFVCATKTDGLWGHPLD